MPRRGITPCIGVLHRERHEYEIDKVTEIRQAPALRAGGTGDRYTIYVQGKQSYLFFERSPYLTGSKIGRWFVERRVG